MSRNDEIVRLTDFLDRHGGSLRALPGVTDIGVGPRGLVDVRGDVVVQVFVQSAEAAARVRAQASTMLDPRDLEVYVRGERRHLEH